VLVTDPITISPRKLTFSAPGQQQGLSVSEAGKSSWTAMSSNTAVATVVQGGAAASFTVTSAGVDPIVASRVLMLARRRVYWVTKPN
jgi:hypothetical protein